MNIEQLKDIFRSLPPPPPGEEQLTLGDFLNTPKKRLRKKGEVTFSIHENTADIIHKSQGQFSRGGYRGEFSDAGGDDGGGGLRGTREGFKSISRGRGGGGGNRGKGSRDGGRGSNRGRSNNGNSRLQPGGGIGAKPFPDTPSGGENGFQNYGGSRGGFGGDRGGGSFGDRGGGSFSDRGGRGRGLYRGGGRGRDFNGTSFGRGSGFYRGGFGRGRDFNGTSFGRGAGLYGRGFGRGRGINGNSTGRAYGEGRGRGFYGSFSRGYGGYGGYGGDGRGRGINGTSMGRGYGDREGRGRGFYGGGFGRGLRGRGRGERGGRFENSFREGQRRDDLGIAAADASRGHGGEAAVAEATNTEELVTKQTETDTTMKASDNHDTSSAAVTEKLVQKAANSASAEAGTATTVEFRAELGSIILSMPSSATSFFTNLDGITQNDLGERQHLIRRGSANTLAHEHYHTASLYDTTSLVPLIAFPMLSIAVIMLAAGASSHGRFNAGRLGSGAKNHYLRQKNEMNQQISVSLSSTDETRSVENDSSNTKERRERGRVVMMNSNISSSQVIEMISSRGSSAHRHKPS